MFSLPPVSIVDLFRDRVVKDPGATAAIHGTTSMSYKELDDRSNQLAHRLISAGAGAGSLIGIAVPRSVEMLIAVLAVMKTGAGYLPIDPSYPARRIRCIVDDAAPAVVLTAASSAARFHGVPSLGPDVFEAEPTTAPDVTIDQDSIAYVIYTSGSTGRPKGVAVTHSGIVSLVRSVAARADITSRSRVLQLASAAFDAAVLEWCTALSAGAALVLPAAGPLVGADLSDVMVDYRVSHALIPPSLLSTVPDVPLPELTTLILGGEQCSTEQIRRWAGRCRVINAYGPTESTVAATISEPLEAGDSPVIGGPIRNTVVFVLDSGLRPVQVGTEGELYLAGPGLARGYMNQPGLTASRFVANPFRSGERMYRTGDIVRWTQVGTLQFLGRADEQVKVRGFRVEPGEVEAVIAGLPGVAHAVVVAREDVPGEKRLVAYVVATDPRGVPEAVAAQLPSYMVPSAFVFLEALPLTPNGKLDRRALPAPESSRRASTGRRPRTSLEEALCRIFEEVTGSAGIGAEESFFDLGGDSLSATRVVNRIRDSLGVGLSVRVLFEASTPARLASRLADSGTQRKTAPLVPVERPAGLPMSPGQLRLWFLDQLHAASGARATHNIPIVVRLPDDVDVTALRAAVGDVVDRHESLRTLFPSRDGRPEQLVLEPAGVAVPVVACSPEQLEGTVGPLVTAGFDLSSELPVRAALVTVAHAENLLVLVLHHIAVDGWSLNPLGRDLAAAYVGRVAGIAPNWPALPVQYGDYTMWQRAVLGDETDPDSELARQTEYWRIQLANLPEAIFLPTDRPRSAAASYLGDRAEFSWDAELHGRLVDLARCHGVSVFMAVHAALAVLLSLHGAGLDIPIGSPIAGRTDEKLNDLVGFFVNTLVFRIDLSGDPTFAELLLRVRGTALEAYAHQDVPFEHLAEALRPDRSSAEHPLFQVMLAFQHNDQSKMDLGGLGGHAETYPTGTAEFDLTFSLLEDIDSGPAGIRGSIEYRTELFDRSTVDLLIERFGRVVGTVLADPHERVSHIDVLSLREMNQLVNGFNGANVDLPSVSIVDMFSDQVIAAPGATAVTCDTTSVSYSELDARSNQLAHLMIRAGVEVGSLVGIALPRSVEMLVAVLAVVKAGAGYLPIDPSYPAHRIRYIIDDAAPVVVLTTAVPPASFDGVRCLGIEESVAEAATAPDVAIDQDDIAYVIYTSGSTGRPKGVAVAHRAVVDLVLDSRFRDCKRVLVHLPLVFDPSTFEMWVPLLRGGCAVVAADVSFEVGLVRHAAEYHEVDTVVLTAGLFAVVAEQDPSAFSSVSRVWVGGDVLSAAAVSRVLDACPKTMVFNGYGPTEATTLATGYLVEKPVSGPLPIGSPLDNTAAFVLDSALRPVPIGVAGELYLSGPGLARGYLNQPGLTSSRFVANPFRQGERMYRSGDIARWTRTGTLEFLGRADDQVKIRGFRIEPGEVEAVISELRDVAHAAVVVREDVPGEKRLVAYVVAADPEGVREATATLLPHYMMPSAFVFLDALPLTPNGKLDRRALPAPASYHHAGTGRRPRTPEEEALCRIFEEITGTTDVGVEDSFFSLGGDSIMSIRLVSQARKAGLELSAQDVFVHQTVAKLAAVAAGAGTRVEVITTMSGSGEMTMTPIMCWLCGDGGFFPRFSQSVQVHTPDELEWSQLLTMVQAVLDTHDALRMRQVRGSRLSIAEPGSVLAKSVVRMAVSDARSEHEAALDRLNPAAGRMLQVVWFADSAQLLLVAHHLVIDGVSWHVLLDDLAVAHDRLLAGRSISLPPVGTSAREWAARIGELSRDPRWTAQSGYWAKVLSAASPAGVRGVLDPHLDRHSDVRTSTISVPGVVTSELLHSVPVAFRAGITEVFLTALGTALARHRCRMGLPAAASVVDVESHGRHEDLFDGVDLSRTIGWFTTVHPVLLDGIMEGEERDADFDTMARLVSHVKQRLQEVPDHGLGYGLLRHLGADALRMLPMPQVGFNYLGRFAAGDSNPWSMVPQNGLSGAADSGMPLAHALEINAITLDYLDGPVLTVTWSWAPRLLDRQDVEHLASDWIDALQALVVGARELSETKPEPHDAPLVKLTRRQMDVLESRIIKVADSRDDDEWEIVT